ncbi:MAG: hypothetical protein NY202_02460 [Mollicutes bacterium UO1]
MIDLESQGFPVDNETSNNVKMSEVEYLEIAGSTEQLTVMRNVMFLKDDVKGIGFGAQGSFDFELIINKDLSKQSDH